MKRMHHTCDKCKESWDTYQNRQRQLWTVKVVAVESGTTYPSNLAYMDLCRPCMEEMGVLPVRDVPKEEQKPKPTVEDLIREIITVVGYDNN